MKILTLQPVTLSRAVLQQLEMPSKILLALACSSMCRVQTFDDWRLWPSAAGVVNGLWISQLY